MSPTPLPDLPRELVTEIYKSMDMFVTASALSKTSHHFHGIFIRSLSSIREGILGGKILYFDAACELVEAQVESAALMQYPQNSTTPKIDRTARFLLNAKMADEVSEHSNIAALKRMPFPFPRCRDMTSTETETFIRAYYRAMTLASPPGQFIWKGFLEWRVLDICQVLNVITFLAEYLECTPKHMEDGGVITSRKLAQGLMIQATTKDMFRLCHDLIRQPGNAVFVHQHYSKFKHPYMADAAYKDAGGNRRGARLSPLYPSLLEGTRNSLPYLL